MRAITDPTNHQGYIQPNVFNWHNSVQKFIRKEFYTLFSGANHNSPVSSGLSSLAHLGGAVDVTDQVDHTGAAEGGNKDQQVASS
jgi:hypothetical protein